MIPQNNGYINSLTFDFSEEYQKGVPQIKMRHTPYI